MGLLGFKLYYAKIFDENGQFVKNIWFPKFEKTFKYKSKSYNVKTKEASYYDAKGLLWDNRYYIYNISNPDPILLDKKAEPIIDPEMYNIQLENQTAKKLNDLAKGSWFKNLDFKTVITIGAVVVGAYLLLTGKLV